MTSPLTERWVMARAGKSDRSASGVSNAVRHVICSAWRSPLWIRTSTRDPASTGTMTNVELARQGVSASSLPSSLLGGLAQVVEQPVHTRYVPGSNPGTATTPRMSGTLAPRERTAAVARVRRAVATAVDRRGVIVPGEHVLIACSGGPDSTALLDALARLAPPRRWRLSAVHVDHGLRPEIGGRGRPRRRPRDGSRDRVPRRSPLQVAPGDRCRITLAPHATRRCAPKRRGSAPARSRSATRPTTRRRRC